LDGLPSSSYFTRQVTLPDTGYKVICYFTNWAWYRPDSGKYTPDSIDSALCTHVIYGFVVLHPTDLVLKVHDPWADVDNKFFERVIALKRKGVKVSVGLGGWNDSLGDKYSRLVNDPAARKRFIDNAIQFIQKYGFDGMDLDWEYPKCWQVDCKAGPDSDKEGFTEWVKELSAEFKPRGWLLSAAVSPSKAVIDAAYDVAQLSDHFDWIGVMTYDYFGNWDKETGHVAPMYEHEDLAIPYFNTNFTLNYWKQLGADPKKLIMGIPMYGQSFTLRDPKINGLGAPASGPGEAGQFTRQGGFLSYYEVNTHHSNTKIGLNLETYFFFKLTKFHCYRLNRI
jgi:chitinase